MKIANALPEHSDWQNRLQAIRNLPSHLVCSPVETVHREVLTPDLAGEPSIGTFRKHAAGIR